MPDGSNITVENIEPLETGMVATFTDLVPDTQYTVRIYSNISFVFSEPATINASTGKLLSIILIHILFSTFKL